MRVGAFPVSIDFAEFDAIAAQPATAKAADELRQALGSPRRILLGVDRLDYTKGIDVRLQAFRELLDSGVTTAGETVLVQVATPEPRARHDLPAAARARRARGRAASTANSAASVTRRSTTSITTCRARTFAPCTPLPMSCS